MDEVTPHFGTLDSSSTVFVAGHGGLAGSAVWRLLTAQGFTNLVGRRSSELDLRDRGSVIDFVNSIKPDVIVVAAARVGGISANKTFPVEYLSENLQIQLNVLDAARDAEVERLLFIGSSAAYPQAAISPIAEDQLMHGPPEPAHAGYALAKLTGVQYVRSMRARGAQWSSVLPTNIYGPHDNFHLEWSHVVPALVRRFVEAHAANSAEVPIWGAGAARREFLYSDDLAEACLAVLANDLSGEPYNVGPGDDVTIADLAYLVADATEFTGEITFDPSRPEGATRRLLDSSRLRGLGWQPATELPAGLRATRDWFVQNWPNVRH